MFVVSEINIRTVSQLEDNVKALEFKLSQQQIEKLDNVSKFELGFPHNFIGQVFLFGNKFLICRVTKPIPGLNGVEFWSKGKEPKAKKLRIV